MKRTLDMFGKPRNPRNPPRVLMHLTDAGHSDEDIIAKMECAKCGSESGWIKFRTITEVKRGIPCERCNSGEDKA